MKVQLTTVTPMSTSLTAGYGNAPAARPARTGGEAVVPAQAAPPAAETMPDAAKERDAHTTAPITLSALSPADRAAIAGATGFYLSPTGEVTPEGTPPWSFIMQYVEHRRAEAHDRQQAGTLVDVLA